MFVEAAIGDAYGAGFEYVDPRIVLADNEPRRGYRKHRVEPGHYTDDTQMAIAIALTMLLADSWTDISPADLASQFVTQFENDPRPGYSQKFYEILQGIVSSIKNVKGHRVLGGVEFLRRIRPVSTKSGGAMRAWPCGLLPTLEDAVDFAMFQASLTHATREGMDAAAAVAALVWCCRQGMDGDLIIDTIESKVPGYAWNIPWKGAVGSSGISSTKAAVTAVCNLHPDRMPVTVSMTGILRSSVAFTGDVDTVACIALAAASVHPGIINDLPKVLYDDLEEGRYGMDFLKALDEMMIAKYPVPKGPRGADYTGPKPEPDSEVRAQPDTDGILGEFFSQKD